MNSIREIASSIMELDNFLIFSHVSMDGDALGSSSALCMALRRLGKNAYVLISEDIPENLDFLEKGCCTDNYEILPEIGVAVMLDCNGYERIKGREEAYKLGKTKICVDHHAVGSEEMDYDYFFCDPHSAATGELVCELIKELGVEFDVDIAECLFAAITTDTGNFQYSNTSRRTHLIAADLHDVEGFDASKVSALIYNRRSREEFKLQNIVLSNLHFYADGKVAVGSVTQEQLNQLGCNISHADPIIQRVMSIKGVEIGAIIKENSEGVFKASLRAKSYANVAAVAAIFGGGGHVKAAGCTLGEDFAGASYRLIDELIKAVNE